MDSPAGNGAGPESGRVRLPGPGNRPSHVGAVLVSVMVVHGAVLRRAVLQEEERLF